MKRKNAIREARRSQHLSRMSHRMEAVAQYKDKLNGKGEIVESTYLGHIMLPMKKVFQGTLHAKDGSTNRFSPLPMNVSRVIIGDNPDEIQKRFVSQLVG